MSRFPHRLAFIAASAFALSGAALASSALLGACGGEDTTTGERVTLRTSIVAYEGLTEPLTNAYGWSVTLTKVAVSVGALYYFDGAPIFSAGLAPAPRAPSLGRRFGLREAHAHPGHYQTGNAMGQMLTASSVDLAEGPADLADGEGTSGVYRSGRFVFGDPPKGPSAAALGGKVVVLEGKATKGAMTRFFRASGAAADALDTEGEAKLEGCAFSGAPTVEGDGEVTVEVKPGVWLDQVDFEPLAEGSEGAPVELSPADEAFKAFARGLKKGTAVVFSYGAAGRW